MFPLAAATTAETQPERVTRASVGKNTVMRMLSAERRAANRVGLYAVAGVLAVVGIVAGLVYYKTQTDVAEQSAQFAQQSAAQASRNDELATRVQQQKQMGLSPAEVVEKFANATVFVRLQWRLYDRETGKPLFQKVLTVPTEDGSVSLPCYVKIGDKYHRWLTTDDEDKKNIRVGGAGSATGFVINDQGLIITNKHVAAGWLVNYWAYSRAEKGQGLLFEAQARPIPQDKFDRAAKTPSRIFNMISNQNKFQQLLDWHPNAGGPVFANSQPVLMGNDEHTFEGRNEELSVRFPGSRVDVEARLLRASADADAALIKIDATHALTTIPIAAGDEVKEGERVTVLGYPSFTAENVAIVTTTEGGELRRNKEVIPQPTVTEGNISNISLPVHQIGAVTIAGAMGHAYQLTVPSWHGNSGGPVFNADGQVIALYTYGSTRETVTYAVPIMYARDLLKMQRSF